jgi:DNA-binding NtrC family response regulator
LSKDRKAILIVEDTALIRLDAADAAAQAGFIVFEAENADQAIAVLEAHPEIRLVFTDVEMPGSMDGLKLVEYISNRWPPIKIIVASGKVSVDKATLPADGLFFPKPYSHMEVLAAMHNLLAA